ncbi:hypothetical protein TNCV_2296461 [Trichonephila clavipes]|nr:hypothetical protein TNCV_2296461 [Trichonephila clavipes]
MLPETRKIFIDAAFPDLKILLRICRKKLEGESEDKPHARGVATAVSMIRGPKATGCPTCVTTVPLTELSFLKRSPEGVLIRGQLRTSYAKGG